MPGGQFTAHVLPEAAAWAFGGDVVVVRLAPDDPAAGQSRPQPGFRCTPSWAGG